MVEMTSGFRKLLKLEQASSFQVGRPLAVSHVSEGKSTSGFSKFRSVSKIVPRAKPATKKK